MPPKKSKGKKSTLKKRTNKTTNVTRQSADYSDDSLNEYEEAQLREAILASKKDYESKSSLEQEEEGVDGVRGGGATVAGTSKGKYTSNVVIDQDMGADVDEEDEVEEDREEDMDVDKTEQGEEKTSQPKKSKRLKRKKTNQEPKQDKKTHNNKRLRSKNRTSNNNSSIGNNNNNNNIEFKNDLSNKSIQDRSEYKVGKEWLQQLLEEKIASQSAKKKFKIQQSESNDSTPLEDGKDHEDKLLQYEKRNLYIYKKIKARYERKIKEAAKERATRGSAFSNIDESNLSMNERLKLRLEEYASEEDQFVIEILETKIKIPKIKIFSSMEELRALSSSPSRSSLSSYSHSSSSATATAAAAAAANVFIRRPKPDYNQYLDKLFIKQPWMTKKDIKYLTDLFTKPESIASCASIKRIINAENFFTFTDEQKIRIMKLIPREDIVPIANIIGQPIDTPYIERERTLKDEFLYEAGMHGQITSIDPTKVTPRFDFWLSDDVKDARWWWQLSIEYGYYTKYGVNQQWDEYENFRCNLPSHWKSDAFEEMWGEILKEGVGNVQLAGDSAKITLPDLVKAKVIKEGDILIYKRSFAKLDITVTTELEVLRVNRNNGCMAVKFGKGKNFRVIEDVQRPTSLEKEILDFDGRIPKSSRPHGNAFKNLSIVKSETYKPSLFEVRKEYWTKNNTMS